MNVYFFFFFLVLRFAIYDYMMHKISITFVDYFPYSGYFFSIPFWTVFWNPVTRESKLWESLIRCFTYLARNLFLHSNHFNLVFFPLDLAFTKKNLVTPKSMHPAQLKHSFSPKTLSLAIFPPSYSTSTFRNNHRRSAEETLNYIFEALMVPPKRPSPKVYPFRGHFSITEKVRLQNALQIFIRSKE